MIASAGNVDDLSAVAGRALLICGHPKSGTSLLLSLLDGHPDVLAFPEETKYFRAIHDRADLRSAGTLITHTRVGRLARRTAAGGALPRVDPVAFERELETLLAPTRRPHEVLPAVMLAYAASRGSLPRSYWAEKTPLHELHLSKAIALWPDLRAIYVLRDPRDVHVSFSVKRQTRGRKLSALSTVRRMRASLRAWDAFSSAHPDRACLVRYEDLVREPAAATRELARFLEIPWTEELLSPTLAGGAWGGNSMFQGAHASVSRSPVGRYRDRLSRWQTAVLERGLAREFARFGWPRHRD